MEKCGVGYLSQDPPSDARKMALIMAIATTISFAIPFVLYFLLVLAYAYDAEAAGLTLYFLAMILWTLSVILGLIGMIISIMALKEYGARLWLVIAAIANAIPPGLFAFILIVQLLIRH